MFGAGKEFDVEHAIITYAEDYVFLPAWAIYDDAILQEYLDRIQKCHIYMIGFMPKVDFLEASQEGRRLFCHMKVLGEFFKVPFDLPDGLNLGCDDGHWYLFDTSEKRYFPSEGQIQSRLSMMTDAVYFDVQYIGQAYGKDGSRNALDRLMKHETLQKISIKGVPDGHSLQLFLIKLQSGNSLATLFNPRADKRDQGIERIRAGIEKLFNPNEAERTTLYEASLIRYFEPKFNKEFKESFPSTNLKVLKDCYQKDFAALVAEISFDELPFVFRSETQASSRTVMAVHNLHKADARDVFFGRRPDT